MAVPSTNTRICRIGRARSGAIWPRRVAGSSAASTGIPGTTPRPVRCTDRRSAWVRSMYDITLSDGASPRERAPTRYERQPDRWPGGRRRAPNGVIGTQPPAWLTWLTDVRICQNEHLIRAHPYERNGIRTRRSFDLAGYHRAAFYPPGRNQIADSAPWIGIARMSSAPTFALIALSRRWASVRPATPPRRRQRRPAPRSPHLRGADGSRGAAPPVLARPRRPARRHRGSQHPAPAG
jgi:hypothetical protein